jgi:hypothetical protein
LLTFVDRPKHKRLATDKPNSITSFLLSICKAGELFLLNSPSTESRFSPQTTAAQCLLFRELTGT